MEKHKTELEAALRNAPADAEARRALQVRLDDTNRLLTRKEKGDDFVGTARSFALIAFGDILIFFIVLVVGFAYLWKRGDLDWVRSTAAQKPVISDQSSVIVDQPKPVLTPH